MTKPLRKEWRIIRLSTGSLLRRLYVNGRATRRFMYDGQMMPPVMGGAPDTVDKQVGASGDDGVRAGTNTFSVDSTEGYVGEYFGKDRNMFARWTGVTYEGTVDVSYIELYAHAAGVDSPLMKVYGVEEADPAAPTTYQEFDADPLTDTAVDWDDAFTINTWEQSPSLNSIFAELGDRSNKAVMMQVKDDGSAGNNYNVVRHYDYAGNAHGPKLHIEFSVGNGVTVAPDPATAIGNVLDPGVILGSVVVVPTPIAGIGAVVNPDVILGSVVVAPAPVTGIGGVVGPTVILGSTTVSPEPAIAIGNVIGPSVLINGILARLRTLLGVGL